MLRSLKIGASCWGAVLALSGYALMAPATADAAQTVNCSTSGQTTTCRIDQPVVTQRLTTVPQVTVAAGDLVTVQAGGCVQTGGSGNTWKRYVNPSGPNADRLYHGLIQIPGAESDLVRVQGVVGHPVSVPSTITGNNALRIGYEDDDYGDNGYYSHDDGTQDQCKNVGNAFLILTIQHHAPVTTTSAPFDLVFTAVDANGFPLNPRWAWQRDHNNALPDADTQCFNLPGIFSNAACTTQAPSLDIPDGWDAAWCAVGAAHSIHGHVNWMPGTWQGTISWESHSSPGTDDDYNVNIVTPGQEGLTVSSEGHIHTEFDSDETIDHFHTPWWNSFHSAVDDSDASAKAMIDGKFAIIVGLVGLDCEHGCATELHPVYAIAIHTNDDPADDTWSIFARNWGDEGYCSQDQHYLDTSQIAFMIPQPNASAVKLNVATTFLTNNSSVGGPSVTLVPGQGAIVSFSMPDPSQRARLNGELHLAWTVSGGHPATHFGGVLHHPISEFTTTPAGSSTVRPPLRLITTPVQLHEGIETEKRIDALTQQLPLDRQTTMHASLIRAPTFDTTAIVAPHAAYARPARPATVRAVADTVKAQKDLARARAICTAYNGTVPGSPMACSAVH